MEDRSQAVMAALPGYKQALQRYTWAVELLGEARTVLTEMQTRLATEIDKVGQAQAVCMDALLGLHAGALPKAEPTGNGHHPSEPEREPESPGPASGITAAQRALDAPAAESFVAAELPRGTVPEQVERADALIRRELADGPRLSGGLRELARLEGIGARAWQAARKRLGVKTEVRGKQARGGVWAVLPDTLPDPPKPKPKPFVYEVEPSPKPDRRGRARSAPFASPKRHDPASYVRGEKRAAVLDALPGTRVQVAERTGLSTKLVSVMLSQLQLDGLVHHPGRATVGNRRVYVYDRTF